jgi:hypothetical protein
MKNEVRIQRGEITIGSAQVPGQPFGTRVGRKLTLADRVAFVLLALGLLALGGVLMAAGLVLLVALATGGLLIGGAVALLRPGRVRPGLAPGEILADARVLPPAQPDRPSSLPVVRGD